MYKNHKIGIVIPAYNEEQLISDIAFSSVFESDASVEFLGLMSHQEWVEFASSADAFLLTSRVDPLPNVALEAMVLGLPVLSFEGRTGIPALQSEFFLPRLTVSYGKTEKMVSLLHSVLTRQVEGAGGSEDFLRYITSHERYADAVENVVLNCLDHPATSL